MGYLVCKQPSTGRSCGIVVPSCEDDVITNRVSGGIQRFGGRSSWPVAMQTNLAEVVVSASRRRLRRVVGQLLGFTFQIFLGSGKLADVTRETGLEKVARRSVQWLAVRAQNIVHNGRSDRRSRRTIGITL